MSLDEVLVGRVGRALGLRGETTVNAVTDSPQLRFAVGSQLRLGAGGQVRIASSRQHNGTWVVRFEGVSDRSGAETFRGAELWAERGAETATEAGEFHDTDLIGLTATDPAGEVLGAVVRILHLPAQEVLVLATASGERMVPFVVDLVPQVDPRAGLLVIAPIAGLLEEVGDED